MNKAKNLLLMSAIAYQTGNTNESAALYSQAMAAEDVSQLIEMLSSDMNAVSNTADKFKQALASSEAEDEPLFHLPSLSADDEDFDEESLSADDDTEDFDDMMPIHTDDPSSFLLGGAMLPGSLSSSVQQQPPKPQFTLAEGVKSGLKINE
jgi:hypothetical protein